MCFVKLSRLSVDGEKGDQKRSLSETLRLCGR